MDYKVLCVDTSNGFYRVERYRVGTVLGPIDIGMSLYDKTNGLTIGAGLLAGSVLPGSNRLVFCGRSPAWGGFYVSTMGGAALIFDNLGLNAIHITGQHAEPSILVLNRNHGEEVEVRLEPAPVREIWEQYKGEIGFYALSRWAWDNFVSSYKETPRILAVGPAAAVSDFGAIGSLVPKSSGLTDVDTWAGRGGFGSKLFQDHNICAVIYGGTVVDEDFRDRNVADSWFEQRYDQKMKSKDMEATIKYRYDPVVDTGGTFGVNYAKMGGRILAFNYRTVGWDETDRVDLQHSLVKDHYLKQFNEETIRTKQFRTCGEPCTAVCKKMKGPYKKDYEPYHAMGPQLGIFDQRAAERIVHHADAMGFDAIQIGGVLSWLFDCLDEDLLQAGELGLPGKPKFNPEGFDIQIDSASNADLAIALIDGFTKQRPPLDLSNGARALARQLAHEKQQPRIADLLVINSFGNRGWMVPNQYWTPGMFSPMAIMGKYYSHYGDEFYPPEELGAINAKRFIRELMIDNSGICRFHRAWAEEMIPDIYSKLFGDEIEMESHHRRLAKRITARNMPIPWESARVVEILHQFLSRKKLIDGVNSPELDDWIQRFEEDKDAASLDFWYDIHKGVMKALIL